MNAEGHPGAGLSLLVWVNLMRFIPEGGITVRELAEHALEPAERMKFGLGCLERWRFIYLRADAADERPMPMAIHRAAGRELREGWGSGRGIRAEWIVRLTRKGQKAAELWPPLFAEIEERWEKRFGESLVSRLKKALLGIVERVGMELPQGLPIGVDENETYPVKTTRDDRDTSLPTLLSQALLAYTIEFNRESEAPLALAATTLRILGEKPIREADIPRLTGGSPEVSGIGWQLKPYITVGKDSSNRGKVVRLNPRGLKSQEKYHQLTKAIEKRWEDRFGEEAVRELREALQELFAARDGERPLIAEGLLPPAGTMRAGMQAPALGRKEAGAAAKQRMRDLVTQTRDFVLDPAGALPHYPLWDMNRGFGP